MKKSDDLYPISHYDMIPSFKDTGDRPGDSGPDQTGFYFNRDCRSNQVTDRKRSKRCRETTRKTVLHVLMDFADFIYRLPLYIGTYNVDRVEGK